MLTMERRLQRGLLAKVPVTRACVRHACSYRLAVGGKACLLLPGTPHLRTSPLRAVVVTSEAEERTKVEQAVEVPVFEHLDDSNVRRNAPCDSTSWPGCEMADGNAADVLDGPLPMLEVGSEVCDARTFDPSTPVQPSKLAASSSALDLPESQPVEVHGSGVLQLADRYCSPPASSENQHLPSSVLDGEQSSELMASTVAHLSASLIDHVRDSGSCSSYVGSQSSSVSELDADSREQDAAQLASSLQLGQAAPIPPSALPGLQVAGQASATSVAVPESQDLQATSESDQADHLKIWALIMLSLAYVHQSVSGCALPAMLPLISPDLNLNDFQDAMLTSAYFYLYAVALIPVGFLADKMNRPALLAGGLALWSALTMKMAQVHDFHELLVARVAFAAAQATQNPISFALIPDLFPKNKTTALAVYNCAIYLGRALSFAAVMLAKGGEKPDMVSAKMVPLENLDLHTTSILYTQGDMAAVLPIYDYNYQIIEYGPVVHESSWRHLFWWIGVPGLFIAVLLAITVKEPRHKTPPVQPSTQAPERGPTSDPSGPDTSSPSKDTPDTPVQPLPSPPLALGFPALFRQWATKPAMALAFAGEAVAPSPLSLAPFPMPAPAPPTTGGSLTEGVTSLLSNPAFLAGSLAAALNDVGSYALIAWHSTFYERVFELDSSVYAPMLAVVLPLGGIVGGVGGGFLADFLDKNGGRAWLTVGASLAAAPFIAWSLLAPSTNQSFLALLIGFALSEAWRAPASIMIRGIAPPHQASTATALYLCLRNLIGGTGPLVVAQLAEQVGLQKSLLLVPSCYVASGMVFLLAEHLTAQHSVSSTAPKELPPPSS